MLKINNTINEPDYVTTSWADIQSGETFSYEGATWLYYNSYVFCFDTGLITDADMVPWGLHDKMTLVDVSMAFTVTPIKKA